MCPPVLAPECVVDCVSRRLSLSCVLLSVLAADIRLEPAPVEQIDAAGLLPLWEKAGREYAGRHIPGRRNETEERNFRLLRFRRFRDMAEARQGLAMLLD